MAEIRLVTDQDYASLASFLASFPEESHSQDYWLNRLQHWWNRNPAFSKSTARGWTISSRDRTVGFLGNIPTTLKVADQELTVYNATTWRVLPEFRSDSLNLLMTLMRAARDSVLFDTTPSSEVVEILRGLGFMPLSELSARRSVAVTALDQVARLKVGFGPLSAGLIRTVTWPVGRIAPLGNGRLKPVPGLEVKHLDHADEGFDRLWEGTRDQCHVTNVRTSKVINWYCFGSPSRRKELFACYRGGQLVGYMVCVDHKSTQARHLECVDLWTDSNNLDVARALLSEMARYARLN